MATSSHFGSFELAPNDRLWVEPTSIYGLLNLFYDPVSWVAARRIVGVRAVLEVPYVFSLEPHAGEGTINEDQILVQGIDHTSLITVRLGAKAGARLFEHIYKAQDFQAFERAVLDGARSMPVGGAEVDADRFQSHVIPALFRVLHRQSTDAKLPPCSSPQELYDRFRLSQAGKQLDATEVLSPSGNGTLLYVHFCVWPNPGGTSLTKLTRSQAVAEKQCEVALFQVSTSTDPTFLPGVLNSGDIKPEPPVFAWNPAGAFTLRDTGAGPDEARFVPTRGGIRLTHIGKDSPLATPVGTEELSCNDNPPESACEILVAVLQPDGTYVYTEVYGKPYEG